jgi:GAF domain-containing protein
MKRGEATKKPVSGRPAESDEWVGNAPACVERMLKKGTRPSEILSHLVAAAEAVSGPDSTVSILILDKEGLLRNGASPNLPPDYLEAIDGLKPHPDVGTCAAAAATGSVVLTPDFQADDKWAELRHWPMALGFVGAWSVPIKSSDGTVLGTFGTYFRNVRVPTPEERKTVEHLASAAALVLPRL